jgi:hypothetical protein
MAKKHVKNAHHSWSKKMQIKTTLRFPLTPVRITTIKNTNNKKVGEDVGKRNPHTLLVGI